VDPGVGIEITAPPGTSVRAGDVVMVVRHRAGRGLAEATSLLEAAVVIGNSPPASQSLVVERITEDR
jgi:thymidine phosphorylase